MEVKLENLRGDIFIVPNGLMSVRNTIGSSEEDSRRRFENNRKRVLKNILDHKDSERLVEIWVCSPENDNWHDHSYIQILLGKKYGRDEDWSEYSFPMYLPIEFFEGKKEGNVVKLNTTFGEVELTLAQTKYRYRRFGDFEYCLKNLIKVDEQLVNDNWV